MRIGGTVIRSDSLTSVSGTVVSTQGPNQVAVKSRVHAYLSANQSSNISDGDHVKFDTVFSSVGTQIALNNSTAYTTTVGAASIGRFLLKSGFTYRLRAGMAINASNG